MIEVKNLTKEFRMNKKYPGFTGAVKSFFTREQTVTRAVDDVSFHIDEGEVVGYIGANGAGKSTTIKMMTGILTPTMIYLGKLQGVEAYRALGMQLLWIIVMILISTVIWKSMVRHLTILGG
jgi:ABC-type uncharacterized transport system ATPase subunit